MIKSLPGQKSLFPELMYAEFSDDRVYRYSLSRHWGSGERMVNFILLNPSTADEINDDPTIRRCIKYAELWEYDGLIVTNLFALRTTDPGLLARSLYPVGPGNNQYLLKYARLCDKVICGWGNYGVWQGRSRSVKDLLIREVSLYCLALTNSGQPRHPLYLKKDLKPQIWIYGGEVVL